MDGRNMDQGNQFPTYPQQPPPPAPPRRGLDWTTWFGISLVVLVVFVAGTAIGSTSAKSAATPMPAVTVTAKPVTMEVTPASCIDALDKHLVYLMLVHEATGSIDGALGGAYEKDVAALDAATAEVRAANEAMGKLSPSMDADSKACRAKAK